MKQVTLIVAAVALQFVGAGQVAAELIDVSYYNSVAANDGGVGTDDIASYNDDVIPTAATISASVGGASARETFSATQLGGVATFEWNYSETKSGSALSYGQVDNYLLFTPNSNMNFALTSTWDGLTTSGYTQYKAELLDLTTSSTILFDSNAVANHSGSLISGHAYQLYFGNFIYNFGPHSDISETASGEFSFTASPVPEPSSIALLTMGAIGAAFGVRRCRQQPVALAAC